MDMSGETSSRVLSPKVASKTNSGNAYRRRVTTTLIYSLLSSTLSVVNKYTLDEFPFPAFVLAVQLTSSALVIHLGSKIGFVNLSSVSQEVILGFVPLTLSFFFLLASSLLLMANSPFNVFLICKSLTPFFTSLSETLYFRTSCPTLQSFLAMAGMALGSALYTMYDADLSVTYLLYAVLFICCSVFEGLIAKQTIQKFALNQTTRTLLMNTLACPIAITWSLCMETTAPTQIKLRSAISLGISCVLGLGMGIATMNIRTIFSATYVSVVGVCNKFLSLGFAGLILNGSPTFQSTLATVFVLLCGSFYNGNGATSTVECTGRLLVPILLVPILFVMIVGTMNERPFVRKLPLANNDGSSATSGRLFLGSKTRLYEDRHRPWTSLKSSWGRSGISRCDHFAVVTTIFAPSEAVIDSCRRLREYQGCLLVIGDAKGPVNYTLSPEMASCSYNFVSYNEQQNFGGSFARALPHNHFGRKNLGYVAAIRNGAKSVWDFDDDNIFINDKMSAFLESKKEDAEVQVLGFAQSLEDVLNPYPVLGSTHFAWPRGFPLTQIKTEGKTPKQFNTRHVNASLKNIGVVQSLANHDPDVDAIYRLQRKLPLNFMSTSEATILPVPLGTMSPFNAQATLWATPKALWGLYLPVSVHGRVSDIWRSYIFQRLAKEVCLQIAFSASPWVEQRRNAHSYIADLDAEHDLYFKTERLLEFLSTWLPLGKSRLLSDMFVELYVALYEREYVDAADVLLSRFWIEELKFMGYSFPEVSQSCTGTSNTTSTVSTSASSTSTSTIIDSTCTTSSSSTSMSSCAEYTSKYKTYWHDEVYYDAKLHALITSQFKFVPFSHWWAKSSETDRQLHDERLAARNFSNEVITFNCLNSAGVLFVTFWHDGFGHSTDTLLTAANFFHCSGLAEDGFKFAFSIPDDYPGALRNNLLDIASILFGERFINIHQFTNSDTELVKMKHVLLLENYVDSPYFLSYPLKMVRRLHATWSSNLSYGMDHVQASSKDCVNVFVTRGEGHRPNGILKNFAEVVSFFKDRGFVIIDPAEHTNLDFFSIARRSCNVVITNGSALASLMLYFPQTARVFILNSAGYQPTWRVEVQTEAETPENATALPDFEKAIWSNALTRFNHTYVDSVQNVISVGKLERVLDALYV